MTEDRLIFRFDQGPPQKDSPDALFESTTNLFRSLDGALVLSLLAALRSNSLRWEHLATVHTSGVPNAGHRDATTAGSH